MSHLVDFYMNISLGEKAFDAELGRQSCMHFCELYGALEREAERNQQIAWKAKPKMHMFQELAEYQSFEIGNPAGFWNYMDEDYMRFVAGLAFRRGGAPGCW